MITLTFCSFIPSAALFLIGMSLWTTSYRLITSVLVYRLSKLKVLELRENHLRSLPEWVLLIFFSLIKGTCRQFFFWGKDWGWVISKKKFLHCRNCWKKSCAILGNYGEKDWSRPFHWACLAIFDVKKFYCMSSYCPLKGLCTTRRWEFDTLEICPVPPPAKKLMVHP